MIVMIRSSLMQTRPQLPGPRRSKQRKDSKEDTRKLQPQNTRQPRKVPPYGLPKPFAPASQTLFALKHLHRRLDGLIHQSSPHGNRSWLRSPLLNRPTSTLSRPGRRIRRSRRIYSSYQRLRSRTGPHSKRTTEANRVHTQKCSRSLVPAIVCFRDQLYCHSAHPTFCQQ
jgi:hypothetical protein